MRGGTSKGVFFRLQDLPEAAQRARRRARRAAAARDRQPRPLRQADRRHGRRDVEHQQDRDPVAEQRGRTTTSTTCSARSSSTSAFVDWSGNCGNLSAAVGPFAIASGLVDAGARAARRRGHRAHLAGQHRQDHRRACADDRRRGAGNRRLRTRRRDLPGGRGAARIHRPGGRRRRGAGGAMFPTGNLVDDLDVPGVGTLKATLINAGIPTIFVDAAGHRLHRHRAAGRDQRRPEGAGDVRDDPRARRGAHGPDPARRRSRASASTRPRSPSSRRRPTTSRPAARRSRAGDVDLLVRALSMGKLHHAMMGTAAVAIGTAAAIPGTLVNLAAGGGERAAVRFGHPSGTLRVGAEARAGRRRVDGHQGRDEPQRARADGRLRCACPATVSEISGIHRCPPARHSRPSSKHAAA